MAKRNLKIHVHIEGNGWCDDPKSPPPHRQEGAKPQCMTTLGGNGCCDDPHSLPLHRRGASRHSLSLKILIKVRVHILSLLLFIRSTDPENNGITIPMLVSMGRGDKSTLGRWLSKMIDSGDVEKVREKMVIPGEGSVPALFRRTYNLEQTEKHTWAARIEGRGGRTGNDTDQERFVHSLVQCNDQGSI